MWLFKPRYRIYKVKLKSVWMLVAAERATKVYDYVKDFSPAFAEEFGDPYWRSKVEETSTRDHFTPMHTDRPGVLEVWDR